MDSNTRVLRPRVGTATAGTEIAAAKSTQAAAMAGQGPSPLQDLTKVLVQQVTKHRPTPGSRDAATLAGEMLGCLGSTALDFTLLSGQGARLLATLPAETWAIFLQQQARERPGDGITTVTLSRALSEELVKTAGNSLVDGLGQLPGLTHLIIVDPPRGLIDLTDLHVLRESLSNIEIRSTVAEKWDLHVPQGMTVYASLQSRAIEKSTVQYHEGRNKVGEPRTLGGAIYSHQSENFSKDQGIRNNGLLVNEHEADPNKRNIWCRHLAVMWLRARLANQTDESRFDYGPFQSIELLSAAFAESSDDLEDDFLRRIESGANALFTPEEFGNLLAKQFDGISPGTTRRFVIDTLNHTLALELRVKTAESGAPEYVVTLYEPNQTALHERLVVHKPELLRNKSLADWLPAGAIENYFPEEEGDPIGALYAWHEGQTYQQASDAAFLEHLPAQFKTSPRTLNMALTGGRTELAGEILDKAITGLRSGSLTPSEFEQCLAAASDWTRGLTIALAMAKTETVRKYVGCILEHSPRPLTSSQAVELLLSPDMHNQPALHTLASAANEGVGIEIAISTYIHAIVSSASLALEDKIRLCAASYDGVTAAQAALENNPEIAAAMACAILQADIDSASRDRLLASLGVDARDVLDSLTGTPDPVLTAWAARPHAA